MDYKGAEILAKLLCEDPSCHLVAVVLVNLTYDSSSENNCNINDNDTTAIEVEAGTGGGAGIRSTDSGSGSMSHLSLGKQLLATNGDTSLVESLAFALRVSSLTQDEYEERQATIEDCNYSEEYLTPATRLSILVAKDQQLRSTAAAAAFTRSTTTSSTNQILRQLQSDEQHLQKWGTIGATSVGSSTTKPYSHSRQLYPPAMMVEESSQHMYPETAKWCLSALRNLTKPCNDDATAAHVLIKSGIYSLIVQYITLLPSLESDDHPASSTSTSTVCSPSSSQMKSRITSSSRSSTATSSSSTTSSTTTNYNIDDNFLSASYGAFSRQNAAACARSTTGDFNNSNNNNNRALLPAESNSNSPYSWDSNSMQDAALSIVLNLSASSKSREYMHEPYTVKILSAISKYPKHLLLDRTSSYIALEQNQVMNFQCLKAVRCSFDSSSRS